MAQIPDANHRELDQRAPSISNLSLDDISLSISATTLPYSSALPPIPRLPLSTKQSSRNPKRPSTASSAEERNILLPSFSSSASDLSITAVSLVSEPIGGSVGLEDTASSSRSISALEDAPIREMNRRAHEAVEELRAEASRLSSSVNMLPSPFDPSPADDQVSALLPAHERGEAEIDYDWATFVNAYALGRWDPLRTPNPPRSHLQAPCHPRASRVGSPPSMLNTSTESICQSPMRESPEGFYPPPSDVDTAAIFPEESGQEAATDDSVESAEVAIYPSSTIALQGPQSAPLTQPAQGQDPGESRPPRRLSVPFTLGAISHRLRNSFTDLRPGPSMEAFRHPAIPATDATTSAAAIRWAAARVSVAPLALPSPEHELTDPMRGVTATIPGSHPPEHSFLVHADTPLASPGGVRKSRLSSFWQGTQDVDDPRRLPTIQQSPPDPEQDEHTSTHKGDNEDMDVDMGAAKESGGRGDERIKSMPFIGAPAPPATAPVKYNQELLEEDYFGSMDPSRLESLAGAEDHRIYAPSRTDHPDRQISAPPFEMDPMTVPALPRRICLTRQTSAPLPTSTLYERRMRAARPASESFVANLAGRAAKEEQMYSELGYLAPPNPPKELERRRALYKFNIWGTGRDPNFDRIVHLVKLVFNTKIVTISLIDGTEEFFKSESGFDTQNMHRSCSFDAHAILQRDDEPMVVLDAQDDWRFAKNPLVLGEPRIRFYAGCPLRTQDGYNIGSLSIIDDTPRREFSPRQRHTLKEFAQIAMRELELWRDKIQLRIRDRIQSSMEQFTRECLDLDKEAEVDKGLFIGTSMEQVYERAARLVKRTLDIEGAMVLDVSHVDVLETVGAESTMSITLHSADRQAGTATSSKLLSRDEYDRLAEFFARNPEGKICEGVVPTALRPFLPARIQYALAVPIFNIDKQPFALLCAYSTGERTTPFLEGHELSYLRAIGVIILSAVLKRRMILADKAKSLFISNISHELRTPLHGILASAELLSDTNLDHSQASFLHTVQACGTSLVETVNHVLDFTKLSGNSRSGGVGHAIHHSKVDLMQLVEEATEGCWIGHRARMFTSEIGSVYSPPKHDSSSAVLACPPPQHVETVIDIGNSKSGWTFLCEKGGIRRVLMNVFGNSLKFTSDGFVHVMLRQLPPASDTPKGKVKIEMSVIDTGKGISQNFLKNQLFHPFSQENPLQTGTGLGLAIVNSIVRSSSVDGKVDVWSAEGVGTEIKITFNAEAVEDEDVPTSDEELRKVYAHLDRPTISLIGFNEPHRGVQLLRSVVKSYLVSRWDFVVAEEDPSGQIIVANEDLTPVANAVEDKQSNQPFIILSSLRGDPRLMNTVSEYERIGGFCRIVYKPVGPVRLYSALKMCLHVLNMEKRPNSSPTLPKALASAAAVTDLEDGIVGGTFPRRFSEENNVNAQRLRPSLGPRAATVHPLASWSHMTLSSEPDGIEPEPPDQVSTAPNSPNSSTVSVGAGGTLLKSSVGALGVQGPVRVLVIEDNNILRGLLIKWLRNKGYDYREAVDGQEGVRIFETEGHFDVVLVDLSMPVLDGVGATTQMRSIEMTRTQGAGLSQSQSGKAHSASILALTGMSSLEDKRRAFEAGVDGYIVKPVAFKTLDTLFHKLGVVS